MRITCIQLILATIFTFSLYANEAHSQSVLEKQISLSADKMAMRDVLKEIKQQTGVKFTYSSDVVDLGRKISCNLAGTRLKAFFETVLQPIGIDFKVIDDEQILLYQAAVINKTAVADIKISGTIKSESGESLPGVSIRIKGTSNGTTTDANGNFTLSVPGKQSVLEVSYIGYQSQEITVGEQTTLNIILKLEDSKLNEVVVVGYGTQKKKDLTGAVAVVGSEAIENRPIVSAAAGLQGQAAGVNVFAASGKPGYGLTVSIRGTTSLNAKNDPLYVVDGVIVENIDFLNPNDIASFSVLKDAASAAIYGASGANGVVLITTKKGKSGKATVTVNAYTGFSNFAKKIDVLNRDQYLDLIHEMGYVDDGTENTDWQDVTFKTGHEQNLQLGVSGGDEKNRYYISAGYQKQQGVVAPADYDRYSVRVNLENKVKEWMTLSTNLAYSRSVSIDVPDNSGVARGGTILSALSTPPTLGIWKSPGVYSANVNQASMMNPIAFAFAPDQKTRDNRVIGNMAADFKIAKGLSFRSNFGIESQGNRYDYFLDPYSTDLGRDKNGYGISTSIERFVWLWENTLNYKTDIEKHHIEALVGHTMQESDYNYSHIVAREYPNGSVGNINAAAIKEPGTITTKSQWSKRSYLARLNYAYADKYLLQANVRYDGSSRFPSYGRFGWFPSVSAAWRINKEDFFHATWVDDLKLRVGWGKTGNDGIGDYDYYGRFTPDGTGGLAYNNIAKDSLKWEKTAQTNIGVDLSILNGRLTFTADAYLKKTSDLLVAVQTAPSSGFNNQVFNVGEIQNKGLEFGVNAVAVDKAVRWDINGNISFNRNRVNSLGRYTKILNYGGIYERTSAIRVEPGRPLGSFYGYISDGVDPNTGNIMYRDLDKSGGLSDGDRTYIGLAQPKFIYGLTNNVRWKNLELNVFFQGVQGNDMFNASRIELEGMYDSKNQSTAVLRRWTTPGQVTDIPKATKGSNDNSLVSTRFIEDGSYLRLKALTVSYNLTHPLVTKAGFNRLQFYVTGQNLFTITNYSGFDPEVSQNNPNGPALGIDYGTYPQSRSFIFGVNAAF